MGKVIRKLAEGTVPEKTIFDKRLVVECCETFHLHWRNLRLELDHANWQDFIATMLAAEKRWREGGSPPAHDHFELHRTLIDTGGVLNGTSAGAELCENLYKTAPPPFGLHADFYDDDEFVHFHYRDLRVEMSVPDFLSFSKVMADARERLLEDGSVTLARLFARLDEANVLYAVSRNWENLPDGVEVGPHSDLDLLVHPAHLAVVEQLWGAKPTNPTTNPAQRKVPVVGPNGEQSYILCDLRAPGDGYFPGDFAHAALARRTRNPKGFWTVAPRDHFLGLAYHVVHHKGLLTDDYADKLRELAPAAGFSLPGDERLFAGLVAALAEAGVAFVRPDDPFVLPKLPYLYPVEQVLYSRFLCVLSGFPVLSRVYRDDRDGEPAAVKQATGALASREAELLRKLDSRHFPRVLGSSEEGSHSTCRLEWIDGTPLTDAAAVAPELGPDRVTGFLEGCVELLGELQAAGIRHRDVTPRNLIVRGGQPVLLDFCWAVAPGMLLGDDLEHDLARWGLGETGRPPEGGYCDVHALGVALRPLAELLPAAQPLVDAMTAPLPARVTDPRVLLEIVRGATPAPAPAPAAGLTILCFGEEVAADPPLLAAAARELGAGGSIAIYAPGATDETVAALERAVEAAGLDESSDLVVLTVEPTAENERELAAKVDALATRRPAPAPFDELRRIEAGPRYELAACTIFRNEAPYLREWIEFHRLVGVEHFYLYDNRSDDGVYTVLDPYVCEGLVTLVDWPSTQTPQCPAYTHCAQTYGHEARWIAFMDADEFFYSPSCDDVRDALREFEPYGGVHVNYVNYGTSGRETKPEGTVIESYLRRAAHDATPLLPGGLRAPGLDPSDPKSYHPINARVSSVIQPARVLRCDHPHFWTYRPGWHAVTENHEPHTGPISEAVSVSKLRMNHYWSKSVEECRAKFERGRADVPDPRSGRAWPGDFHTRNAVLNDVEDTEILRHLPALRAALGLEPPRPTEELLAECSRPDGGTALAA